MLSEGHCLHEPRTHGSAQLMGSSLDTVGDEHMTRVKSWRQDEGINGALFFRKALLRALVSRRVLA